MHKETSLIKEMAQKCKSSMIAFLQYSQLLNSIIAIRKIE